MASPEVLRGLHRAISDLSRWLERDRIPHAVAGRPRDIADIAGLLEHHPRISRARIRRFTSLFAESLDEPEIARSVEELLKKDESLRRERSRARRRLRLL